MIATVLIAAGYSPESHFRVHEVPATGAENITEWRHPTDDQPTAKQLEAWRTDAAPLPNGQAFSQWLAEHGGDPVLTARRQTREALSAAKAESALHRAAFLVLVDEFNRHTEKFTALRDALSTATSLADAKAKAAAIEPLPQRIGQDLRNAAIEKIDSGAADS